MLPCDRRPSELCSGSCWLLCFFSPHNYLSSCLRDSSDRLRSMHTPATFEEMTKFLFPSDLQTPETISVSKIRSSRWTNCKMTAPGRPFMSTETGRRRIIGSQVSRRLAHPLLKLRGKYQKKHLRDFIVYAISGLERRSYQQWSPLSFTLPTGGHSMVSVLSQQEWHCNRSSYCSVPTKRLVGC